MQGDSMKPSRVDSTKAGGSRGKAVWRYQSAAWAPLGLWLVPSKGRLLLEPQEAALLGSSAPSPCPELTAAPAAMIKPA